MEGLCKDWLSTDQAGGTRNCNNDGNINNKQSARRSICTSFQFSLFQAKALYIQNENSFFSNYNFREAPHYAIDALINILIVFRLIPARE